MNKWPLSLGQINRSNQYDKYVKPLTPAEQIEMTQQEHMRCQKLLSKAMKNLDKALVRYQRSPYAVDKCISDLAKMRKIIFNLKESIKIETHKSLPYADLNEPKTDEKKFMGSYQNISLFKRNFLILFGINSIIYIIAAVTGDTNIWGANIIFSILLVLGLYLWWTKPKKTKKNIK